MKKILPLAILLICSFCFAHAQSTLDSTFAQTGIVHFDFGANSESNALAVVTSPNMTSYTALAKSVNGNLSIHVRSLLANGAVNTAFAQNGNLALFLPPGSEIENIYMQYTSDNHIIGLVSVYNDMIEAYGYMMTKINTSGAPVLSFGTNGVVDHVITNNWIAVTGFAVDAQQNIYVYGTRENQDWQSPVLDYPFIAKHQVNGQLDANFGENGIFNFGLEFNGAITNAAFNANGNLVVLGMNYDLDQESFLAAISTSGNLLPSFGTLGITNINLAGEGLDPVGIYLTSQGHINLLLQGFEFPTMANTMVIYQFNANGLPNLTFGTAGMSSVTVGYDFQFVFATTGLPDNGAVISCLILDFEEEHIFSRLIKLNEDGSLDSTFGEGGIFEFDFDGSSNAVVGLHVASEEKLYASGAMLDLSSETTAGFVARLNLIQEVTSISTPLSDKPFEILAYPNPASDFITVSFSNLKLTETTLHLIDLGGRMVLSTLADFSFDSTHTIQIPEALPAGLYYIGLKSAEGIPVYRPVQVIR